MSPMILNEAVATIEDLVGNTPLIEVSITGVGTPIIFYLKLEMFNPGGSVKDRAAQYIISQAEQHGLLSESSVLVEGSSGNFGLALSLFGCARGYSVKIMVDPRTPNRTVDMIRTYGAEAVLIEQPDHLGKFQIPRMKAAMAITTVDPEAYMPYQWGNPWNPECHELFTGPEIWNELGQVDCLVAAVSTSGHLIGTARHMKHKNRDCSVVAVDGQGSVALGGKRGHHVITGLGSSWVPENLDIDLIDEAYWVADVDGISMCHWIAKHMGLLIGGSAGSVAFICAKKALQSPGSVVVGIVADGGERYLDSVYNADWLGKNQIECWEDVNSMIHQLSSYTGVKPVITHTYRELLS